MGKRLAFGCLMFLVVFAAAGSSRGDVAPQLPPPSSDASPEPITGTPAVSNPGDAVPIKDPFGLFDIGPPGTKGWSYKELTAAEQAWADQNADTTGWDAIHAGYAQASAELAQQAATAAAAHQLGVTDGLAGTGVVP